MTTLPSKELLSAVLDKDVTQVKIATDVENSIQVVSRHGVGEYTIDYINIHELAHMVKEWAIKQGYDIWSGYHSQLKANIVTVFNGENAWRDQFDSIQQYCNNILESEPEAIFKAGEWILKEISK